MNASPVGTPPAGLVCVCDQQQRGFASTEIELLDLIRTAFAPYRSFVPVVKGTLIATWLALGDVANAGSDLAQKNSAATE